MSHEQKLCRKNSGRSEVSNVIEPSKFNQNKKFSMTILVRRDDAWHMKKWSKGVTICLDDARLMCFGQMCLCSILQLFK